MNKRIIYPNDEGGVAVIIPAPDARGRRLIAPAKFKVTQDENGQSQTEVISEAVYEDEADEEFLARIAAKDVPTGKPFKIVDVADVPSDRTFRGAWEYQE